jgi:hypothetical protein
LINFIKKIKLLKAENVFSCKAVHVLYLVSNSKITPENTRLKLILSVKELYNHSNIHQIKIEKANFLKDKLSMMEKIYNEYIKLERVEKYLSTTFTPSKISLNALNYIDQFEEKKLRRLSDDVDVFNMFKILYFLLNRDIPTNPIQYFIDYLISSMKYKSLSNIFLI